MALPDFENYCAALSACKRQDQSWGHLFRSLQVAPQAVAANGDDARLLNQPQLLRVLAEWDFYSSPSLDEAAAGLGVKSWQLIEWIESLREALAITQSDLMVDGQPSVSSGQPSSPGQDPRVPQVGNPSAAQNAARPIQAAAAGMGGPPPVPTPVPAASPPKHVLVLAGVASALFVVLVTLIGLIINQNRSPQVAAPSSAPSAGQPPATPGQAAQPAAQSAPAPAGESISFSGISLPVTNKLCNRKATFCIYGLATLVNNESGDARYSYSEVVNGRQVDINGTITVSNIERNGDNRRFTFAFRDDQSNTTPGYAAAGYFHLDQDPDPAKPGILTRFKTTESFGPKTPVGLENTSYLFPS